MRNLRKVIASFSIVAVLSTLVVSTAAFAGFTDVPANAYYYTAVETLGDLDIINTTRDNYEPGRNLQRDESAKLIVGAAGYELEQPTSANFVDVPTTAWSFDYVETAFANSIISGYAHKPGYFGPVDNVTREQFAKMVVLAFELPEYLPEEPTFPDVKADMWSYSFVETAFHFGIIKGHPDGTFKPFNNINRADGAVMLHRALEVDPVDGEWVDEGEEEEDDGVAGDLIFELNADTPVGRDLPAKATAVEVMVFDVTAGSEGRVDIDSLTFKKTGVSELASDFQAYLFEGNDRLTGGRALNSTTNEMVFTNLGIRVPAGETVTYTLVADVGNTTLTGGFNFEITGESSVESDATEISGLPIVSDRFGLSTTSVGKVTVEKNGSVTNPKIGEDEATIAKFKISADGEGAHVEKLALFVSGTISESAIENLKLYASGETEPVAEVATINSRNLAQFVLDTPYFIEKGNTKSFWVTADFNTGRTGDVVKAFIDETTDVVAIGDLYGFGMEIDWTAGVYKGPEGACTNSGVATCTYFELEGGDVTITSSGPASRDIAVNTKNAVLQNFTIASVAPVTFKSLEIALGLSETAPAGGLLNGTASNITNIRVVEIDSDGKILKTLMGPVEAKSLVDGSGSTTVITEAAGDNAKAFYVFTNEFALSAGEEMKLAITADVANNAALADETLYAELALGASYPVLKDSNNKTLDNAAALVPASPITGKTMTIKSSGLTFSLTSTPASKTYVKGTKDIQFAGLAFACGTASDCTITDITVTGWLDEDIDGIFGVGQDVVAATTYYLNGLVGSIKLVDDSGAVVATSKSVPTNGKINFTGLTWDLNAGETERLYVVGDLSSNSYRGTAGNGEAIAFGIAAVGDVVAENASRNTITDKSGTPNSTYTSKVTTSDGGKLTISVDGSTPKETILVAGTVNQPISKFKFASEKEAFSVKRLTISNNYSAGLGNLDRNVVSIRLSYTNSAGVVETKTGFLTEGVAQFSGLDVYVPEDGDAIVSVEATLNTIPGGSALAGTTVALNIALNNFEALTVGSNETYKADKLGGATPTLSVGTQTYTDTTLATGAAQAVTAGSAVTLTVPNLTVDYPVGTIFKFGADSAVFTQASEELVVLTKKYVTGDLTLTGYVISATDGSVGVAANIWYALPGEGYLTLANKGYVYETIPTLTLNASSPSGAKTSGPSDTIFRFDVAADAKEKVVVQAAYSLDTCVANTGTTLTSASSATSVDGASCEVTVLNAVDRGANYTATGLDNYAFVSFWVRYNDASAAVAINTTDIKVGTAVAAGAPDQATVLATGNVGGLATLAEDTWYFVSDVAMPVGTDSADTLLQVLVADATRINDAADDLFIDQVKAYNNKVVVNLASNGRLLTAAHTDAVYLNGGVQNVTGYMNVASISSASVTFFPAVDLDTSKGTTTNYSVVANTNNLMNPSVNDDLLTPGITYGNATTPGGFWWFDTNAVAKWVGYQMNTSLEGNTLRY